MDVPLSDIRAPGFSWPFHQIKAVKCLVEHTILTLIAPIPAPNGATR